MAGSSPSYGFQESAAVDNSLGLATPFVNEAEFSIYGDSTASDSGVGGADVTPTATQTTSQGMDQGSGSVPAVAPGTGNMAASEGGSSVVVWVTVAGIVIAVLIALTALRKGGKPA